MKKICSLMVLMMLFLVAAPSNAQRRWAPAEANSTEIKSGEENVYLLRSGINERDMRSDYLNSGAKMSEKIDSTAIWSFIEFGEKEDVDGTIYKIYILKNLGNKQFLSDGSERYVSTPQKAFQFTARTAKDFKNDAEIGKEWTNYSHSVNYLSAGAEAAGTWVFCNPYKREYISFGGNPQFTSYCSSSNWYVFEAIEEQVAAYEKLQILFDDTFKEPVEPQFYPVGKGPGRISQEIFDEMLAVYNEAIAIMQDPTLDDAEYDKMRGKIYAISAKYKENVGVLENGFYTLFNELSSRDIYDAGNGLRLKNFGDAWTTERGTSVWEVIMEENGSGRFFLKNWATGAYFGHAAGSDIFPTTAEPKETFSATLNNGDFFILRDLSGNVVYNSKKANDDRVISWNASPELNPASHFSFHIVPLDSLKKIEDEVNQTLLNNKMIELVSGVQDKVNAIMLTSGLTFDGSYNSTGLVTKFEKVNAKQGEGGAKYAFDGDVNSYYYTQWTSSNAPSDFHWVEIDLGKQVSELYVKFSGRGEYPQFDPTQFALVAPDNDQVELDMWADTLCKQDVEYTYATNFKKFGVEDSTTYVGKVVLKRPAQHLRFVVTNTSKPTMIGGGPRWQLSEIRFYDAAECVDNPIYAEIPQNIKDNLFAAIDAAKVEIEAGKCTQETYDALEAANEAFWEAYPDPTALKNALEEAQKMHDMASEELEEMGYFRAGAKETFQAAINEIKSFVDSHEAMSLEEIETYEAKLDAALKAFQNEMIAPENGKVYRILSTAGFEEDVNGGDPKERKPNDGYVAALDADTASVLHWAYKATDETAENRFNTSWLVTKNEAGEYAFKNLATGLYINNPLEGVAKEDMEDIDKTIRFSETPSYFKLGAHFIPGSFSMDLNYGNFFHFQPFGVIDTYGDRESPYNSFTFSLVDDIDGFSPTYTIDVQPKTYQIKTLPIELAHVYVGDMGTALKVAGLKDGNIQLVPFGDDETIPAGTPFIVLAEDEMTTIDADLMNDASIEDNLNLEYNRSVVEANGLISTPNQVVLDAAGYGYIFDNKVFISAGGEEVAAGSGYFTKNIKATDVEGDYVIKVNGEISNGDPLAVENVEIVKNVNADVYTIAGVKVRSNVKMSNATKNLPKGIYVVAGQKVIVK